MYYIIPITFLLAFAMVLARSKRRKSAESAVRPVRMHGSRELAVVNEKDSMSDPYPYIYVNGDGTVRELRRSEKDYLETPFYGGDGGRPYIKSNYEQKNGWGRLSGFLERTRSPSGILIIPAPSEEPAKKLTRDDQLQILHEKGFEVVENSDGTVTATKRKLPDTDH